MPTTSSRRCSRPARRNPSCRPTRCRPTACAGSTFSASTKCATATSRKPRAGSTCTAGRCSGFWPSARRGNGAVGWAKAQSAVSTILLSIEERRGHATLCPPYSTACPGRCAARSDALQSRGPCLSLNHGPLGPGSAQQRFTLQRVRDTRPSYSQNSAWPCGSTRRLMRSAAAMAKRTVICLRVAAASLCSGASHCMCAP